MRVRVIGVGTRRGDDAAGLLVVERLAAAPLPRGVEVALCERADVALLDALEGAEAAILVDAVRSGAVPGSLHEPDARALGGGGRTSCHGLGVPDTLALAAALGRAPRVLRIVGIEMGAASDGTPSPAVRRAVGPASARVRSLARGLAERAEEG